MCKYCDINKPYMGNAMEFNTKDHDFFNESNKYASIMMFEEHDYVLSVTKDKQKWDDLPISFCPMCGKELRTKKSLKEDIEIINKVLEDKKINDYFVKRFNYFKKKYEDMLEVHN